MRKLFTLAAFCLATLALNAQESADYVIRTLTFEDADFKGGHSHIQRGRQLVFTHR